MARRAAPPHSGPAYIPQTQSQRRTLADPNEKIPRKFQFVDGRRHVCGRYSCGEDVGWDDGACIIVRTRDDD
ncbi:hypothetical protein MSAN_00221800 [Mycena sanguinolenta]|uniref:Uncharacterized protein n=1 Tax=Mycena sanguinolenta TaxID=230812 RepID=A0A8H7DJS3_9AGAR|nr:hypothetical protein MSAN_00221800 [Mycena sanguinolenta]